MSAPSEPQHHNTSSNTSVSASTNSKLDEIRKVIRTWLELRAQIKNIKAELKKKTTDYKEASRQLEQVMQRHHTKQVNVGSNRIQLETTESTSKTMSKKYLVEHIPLALAHLNLVPAHMLVDGGKPSTSSVTSSVNASFHDQHISMVSTDKDMDVVNDADEDGDDNISVLTTGTAFSTDAAAAQLIQFLLEHLPTTTKTKLEYCETHASTAAAAVAGGKRKRGRPAKMTKPSITATTAAATTTTAAAT